MAKFKLNRPKKKTAHQKKGQRKPTLEELRRTLGFPEGTEFLGYAILLKDSNEFLTEFEELTSEGDFKKIWSSTPQHAVCYNKLPEAIKISEDYLNSVVVGLFDTRGQILTVTMSINR